MSEDRKLKAVLAAIQDLYSDTSVSFEKTRERMELIIEAARENIDAMGGA